MKKCQFCRELIEENSIVCKYCKRKQRLIAPMTASEKVNVITNSIKYSLRLCFFIGIFLLVILFIILLIYA